VLFLLEVGEEVVDEIAGDEVVVVEEEEVEVVAIKGLITQLDTPQGTLQGMVHSRRKTQGGDDMTGSLQTMTVVDMVKEMEVFPQPSLEGFRMMDLFNAHDFLNYR